MHATSPVPLIQGLGDITDRYEVVLCDVWGVLHNGLAAYPGAVDALHRFRQRGGQVILLSNAPRPGMSVARQLDRLGIARNTYDAVVTSGDLTRQEIVARLEAVVHHLGPPRDLPLFDGLPVRFGAIAEADYVVCSGFDNDDVETVDDYRERLDAMRARDLFMVCANPDLVVERGDRLVPCAGALAQAYETMGGRAFYAGKPHRPVYDASLDLAARIADRARVAPERVLAVGDAIRTDIAGAVAFGADSLLIARGIHARDLGAHGDALSPEHVHGWIMQQSVRPTAVMDLLVW